MLPTVVHSQAASIISWTPSQSTRHPYTPPGDDLGYFKFNVVFLGCVVFNATSTRFVPFMMYTLVLEMSVHSDGHIVQIPSQPVHSYSSILHA